MTTSEKPSSIAFLMLAHEHPEICARLARRLLDAGHDVVFHLDLGAEDGFTAAFNKALDQNQFQGDASIGTLHHCRRIAVSWGEWSMVEATLSGLETLAALASPPDHVYLLSGADYPIRPLEQLEAFLQRHTDVDFIEHVNALEARWVRDGPQAERFEYWHGINWRRNPNGFALALEAQRRLGRKRRFPRQLAPHLGAQWWVLSWKSCEKAMDWAGRAHVRRFFRRTWIPDELFFQTIVASQVPAAQRRSTLLTHTLFSDDGIPVVFHDDHAAYLARQPAFFARKLAPTATGLRNALDHQPNAAIVDPEVGGKSDDYGLFLQRHLHGIPGQFSWGRVPDSTTGELAQIDRPWFVVTGIDEALLETARQGLARNPRIQCHDQLFAPDQVGFGEGVSECCGYRRKDTRLRDQAPLAFLADLLRHEPEKLTGFTLKLDTRRTSGAEALLQRLCQAPGCHVIHVADKTNDEELRRRAIDGASDSVGQSLKSRWIQIDEAPGSESDDEHLQGTINVMLSEIEAAPKN